MDVDIDTNAEDDCDVALKNARFKAQLQEAEDELSEEEFVPAASEDEESDEEEEIELEDDEPDTAIEARGRGKKGKKEKAGVTNRQMIRDIKRRDEEVDSRESPTPRPKKSKSTKGHDGIRPNWKPQDDTLVRRAPPSARARMPPLEDINMDDEPVQRPGGMFGDDGEDENGEFESAALGFEKGSNVKSITETIPIETSSTYSTKPARRSKTSRGQKERPTVQKLPPAARAAWKDFKPVLINHAGGLDPWEEVNDEDIAVIWNDILVDEDLVSTDKADIEEYKLFQDVRYLARNHLLPTEWRFNLGKAGLNAVHEEFNIRNLKSTEERVKMVKMMLGDAPRDRSRIKRPFIWGAVNDLDWDGEDPSKGKGGMFKGRMVMKVLSEHFSCAGMAQDENVVEKQPVGALCMAIQSVNRALEYSLSGELKVPGSGDKSGHFSAENWGDYSITTERNGETVVMGKRRATVFLSTIKTKLNDAKWKALVDIARSYMPKKQSNKAAANNRLRPAVVMADDDEVLEDPEDDDNLSSPSSASSSVPSGSDGL